MAIVDRIAEFQPDVAAWRQDIHAHPELLYDVHRTADFVAQRGVLGADVHFLQKPFSLFDFATKIREALATK